MIETLRKLRKELVIGFVGGSDFAKITEQLQTGETNSILNPLHSSEPVSIDLCLVLDEFDYAFSENGLTAFKLGKALPSQSFISFLGEERYKPLVNFILHYIADLDIPLKR
jgi:phosphomannomutase